MLCTDGNEVYITSVVKVFCDDCIDIKLAKYVLALARQLCLMWILKLMFYFLFLEEQQFPILLEKKIMGYKYSGGEHDIDTFLFTFK